MDKLPEYDISPLCLFVPKILGVDFPFSCLDYTMIMKFKNKCSKSRTNFHMFVFIVVFVYSFFSLPAFAKGKPVEAKLPDSLTPSILYLIEFVNNSNQEPFDGGRISPLLDFVAGTNPANTLYSARINIGSPSAYSEFDVDRSFSDLLKYAFHPDIPAVATAPSSMRLTRWSQLTPTQRTGLSLLDVIAKSDGPHILRGLELIENTPDTNSGAYYKYEMDRVLVLFKHRGRSVLISISKQKGLSAVGKKGYVLGSDDDWDYYYSGETGITLTGLGWVRSYMYDSNGINIYLEAEPGAHRVRCAALRWIRAGWSKINMVQPKHIYDGLLRYQSAFKKIIEYPDLPTADVMAQAFIRLKNLSHAELLDKMKDYVAILQKRYSGNDRNSRKWTPAIFKNKTYWQQLSTQEMQSNLSIEYVKSITGRTRKDEVGAFLDFVE